MKKTVALILAIVLVFCGSTVLFAVGNGLTLYFDSGVSQTGFSHEASINFPWEQVPSSTDKAVVTLYSPSPVASIGTTEHFMPTIPMYLDRWTTKNGGSTQNANSTGEKDAYITLFQIRAMFRDRDQDALTKPGPEVAVGDTFQEKMQVALEDGSVMEVPCTLTITGDPIIYWKDMPEHENIYFDAGKDNTMSAYIKDAGSADVHYTVKWSIEGDAVITGIDGPGDNTVNETDNTARTSGVSSSGNQDSFLGSTVTVKPTSTSSFWLYSSLHDSTGHEIYRWGTLIRVKNGSLDDLSGSELDEAKDALAKGDPVVVPSNKGLSPDNLQALKEAAAGGGNSQVTLKSGGTDTLDLSMTFDLNDPKFSADVDQPFTPAYTAAAPDEAKNDGINTSGSQWIQFTYSGNPPAPITVTMKIDPDSALGSAENIVIWRYDSSGKLEVITSAKIDKNSDGKNIRAAFILSHFSTYALYPEGIDPNPEKPSPSPERPILTPSTGGGSGGGGGRSGSSGSTSASILNGAASTPINAADPAAASVSAADAQKAAEKAAAQAKADGNTVGYVRFANAALLPKDALAAVRSVGDKHGIKLFLYADTVVNGKVVSRLAFDPAAFQAAGGIKTGIQLENPAIDAHFQKYYRNPVKAIQFAQQGSFDTDVSVAVKLDLSGFDTAKLTLYTYDAVSNRFSLLPDQSMSIDRNGYLHFNTATGGYLILSSGPLV